MLRLVDWYESRSLGSVRSELVKSVEFNGKID